MFETALFSLESLIRRKALGFEHLAENLAKKLVLLENRFNTEKFEVENSFYYPSFLNFLCDIEKIRKIVFSLNKYFWISFFSNFIISGSSSERDHCVPGDEAYSRLVAGNSALFQ